MNYIQNTNTENDMSYALYPQARYNKIQNNNNYSITNNSNYSKIPLNSRNLLKNDNSIDPITKEISNNINLEFNTRVEDANKLNEAIEMIKNSIMDETEDQALYNMMINQATDEEDKKIISSIASDEKKHNMLLRQIYFQLTRSNIPMSKEVINNNNNTYIENLKNSLFGELEAVKKYRKILSAMTDKENYNKLMEIMTDEITHANKYNYLITKYMTSNKRENNI